MCPVLSALFMDQRDYDGQEKFVKLLLTLSNACKGEIRAVLPSIRRLHSDLLAKVADDGDDDSYVETLAANVKALIGDVTNDEL